MRQCTNKGERGGGKREQQGDEQGDQARKNKITASRFHFHVIHVTKICLELNQEVKKPSFFNLFIYSFIYSFIHFLFVWDLIFIKAPSTFLCLHLIKCVTWSIKIYICKGFFPHYFTEAGHVGVLSKNLRLRCTSGKLALVHHKYNYKYCKWISSHRSRCGCIFHDFSLSTDCWNLWYVPHWNQLFSSLTNRSYRQPVDEI